MQARIKGFKAGVGHRHGTTVPPSLTVAIYAMLNVFLFHILQILQK